jgi:hypothetical protein
VRKNDIPLRNAENGGPFGKLLEETFEFDVTMWKIYLDWKLAWTATTLSTSSVSHSGFWR